MVSVYCINLLDSLLLENMKTGKKDARFVQYSLKHEICIVFAVIPFLEKLRTSKNRTNWISH